MGVPLWSRTCSRIENRIARLVERPVERLLVVLLHDLNLFVRIQLLRDTIAEPTFLVVAQLGLHVEVCVELEVELAVGTSVDSLVFARGFEFADGYHVGSPSFRVWERFRQ